MKRQIRKIIFRATGLGFLLGAFALIATPAAHAVTNDTYAKVPAFLESGIPPNLLLMIDNSASMYDQAYVNPENNNYCFVQDKVDGNADGLYLDPFEDVNGNGSLDDGEDLNGNDTLDVGPDIFNFAPALTYAGYFSTDSAYSYKYNPATNQFEKVTPAAALAFCNGAVGEKYDPGLTGNNMCMTIDETVEDIDGDGKLDVNEDTIVVNGILDAGEDVDGDGHLDVAEDVDGDGILDPSVNAFAAGGNLLNWLTSSKFDIEKKILTGGKYDATNNQLVMEARGCLEQGFFKKLRINRASDSLIRYATFGIRPPTDTERNGDFGDDLDGDGVLDAGEDFDGDGLLDVGYNGSISNTRIAIYRITDGGFDMKSCEEAVDAFEAGNLGTIATKTKTCLEGSDGLAISDSNSAYNHIMQECWYYNKHGVWQNPQNTVNQLKKDCENVYNVPLNPAGDWAAPPVDYVAPETLSGLDICSGQYDIGLAGDLTKWGVGNVGRCWEPDNSVPLVNDDCVASDTPTTGATATVNSDGNYHYCDNALWVWQECIGNYSTGANKCTGDWEIEQVPDPSTPAGAVTLAGWTDDGDPYPSPVPDAYVFDGDEHCIDEVLKDYCGSVNVPTIVDPSGSLNNSGTAWVLPALLVASAVESQLGDPMPVGSATSTAMLGRIAQATSPTGIIHEFQYNLRIGAMEFNNGPGNDDECDAIQERTGGDYVASLYDCLTDKGDAIISTSSRDPNKLDGGRIITYIGQGQAHIAKLANDINSIKASTWTPTVEALFNAVGYFTQDNRDDPVGTKGLRLNTSDFIWDHDFAAYPDYNGSSAVYAASDLTTDPVTYTTVRYKDPSLVTNPLGVTKLYFTLEGGTSASAAGPDVDKGVLWQSFDPVTAACQTNNILLISDGAASADMNSRMKNFLAAAGHNDGVAAVTWKTGVTEATSYECRAEDADLNPISSIFGNSALDDMVYYGKKSAAGDIYPTNYKTIGTETKQNIDFHIVVTGDRPTAADATLECEVDNLLTEAANNGASVYNGVNLSVLETVLRNAFTGIGGQVSSGAAASVISHSRSGDGAIYQAIFYPLQNDQFFNEVAWTGDIHSLWLDELGNIREDCGTTCADVPDSILDKTVDRIIEFYSDPTTNAALARRYKDDNGDGIYDKGECSVTAYPTKEQCEAASKTWTYGTDYIEDGLSLRNLKYIWSAGEWLATTVAEAQTIADNQRAYTATTKGRYIFTSFDGESMVPFMPKGSFGVDLWDAAGSDQAYQAYLNATTGVNDEANDIIAYIRGDDTRFFPDSSSRNYRSRLLDWDGDGALEVYKLGDIIHSTPTLVAGPAENYDVIYGDASYQRFRQRYRYRRSVVYAGGNDGGLHAFNAGYYDRANNRFLKGAPVYGSDPVTYGTQYDLGAEMWMFIPRSALPHLKWLTKSEEDADGKAYNHVYYTDLKPHIFDAKIFEPNDIKHPGGWGTVLVGGMRFGGGDMVIDIDGDGNLDVDEDVDGDGHLDVDEDTIVVNGVLDGGEDVDGDGHLDVAEDVDGDGNLDDSDETIRSSYFILDITDPEVPPILLGEFTDPNLGYSLAEPTAIPMLRCDRTLAVDPLDLTDGCPTNVDDTTTWPMDWYLAIGSGPKGSTPLAGMRGRSDQLARVFLLKLGGTGGDAQVAGKALPYVTYDQDAAALPTGYNTPALARTFTLPAGVTGDTPPGFNNSFFSDMITVDYDFSFQADALYFGSVSEAPSVQEDHNQHRGGMHRLVIDDHATLANKLDPANWTLNTIFNTGQPVTAAPAVASDGSRAWVYFGTGRFLDATYDKKMTTRMAFYGLKEVYDSSEIMQLGSVYSPTPNLVDVTDIQVTDSSGVLNAFPKDTNTLVPPAAVGADTLDSGTFVELKNEIANDKDATLVDKYNGWKINFGASTSTTTARERNIGQAAILGDLVTFTTYVPSFNQCQPEGDSYLWAPYYRTGTAYYRSVLGLDPADGTTVLRKVSLGKGLATTPNIHSGAEAGSKAFVQTSTGAIVGIEQANPGVTKSEAVSWRELSND